MRIGLLVSILALTTLVSCRIGRSPARLPVATSPRGVDVRLRAAPSAPSAFDATGELLAVTDSGLYVLHGGDITLYALDGATEARSRHAGLGWVDLRRVDAASLRELSLYARHPVVFTDEVLGQLLSMLDRDSVTVRRQ